MSCLYDNIAYIRCFEFRPERMRAPHNELRKTFFGGVLGKKTPNITNFGTSGEKLVVEEDYDARMYGPNILHEWRASIVEGYVAPSMVRNGSMQECLNMDPKAVSILHSKGDQNIGTTPCAVETVFAEALSAYSFMSSTYLATYPGVVYVSLRQVLL